MRRSAPIARRNGAVSFWQAALGPPPARPPLDGGAEADVCVVGAGFTGLWAAYRLVRARPELRIVVLERAWAGYGASGRNGGWLTPALAAPHAAMEQPMRDSVADVLATCAEEGIDCDALAGGRLRVARGPAQAARLRAELAGGSGVVALDADTLAARVRVAGATCAAWSPDGVRIQPAKLVRGLAAAAERRGVRICERTAARELVPAAGRTDGRAAAVTDRGVVRAPVVLCCVEGFTPQLPGRRRALLPLNSALVVTEPLADAAWAAIGWEGGELLGDEAHVYFYAQRTADGRIALGGRGVPYRYGSRTDRAGRTQRRTAAGLAHMLRTLFPAAAGTAIEHAWCGVLGVARDWRPAVRLDRASGIGFAGGYVGHGVGAANLAGRTLRDLALRQLGLGEETGLTQLPWVGHTARRWEPEPLRWLGANAVYALYRAADRREAASGSARTSSLARAADLLAGR